MCLSKTPKYLLDSVRVHQSAFAPKLPRHDPPKLVRHPTAGTRRAGPLKLAARSPCPWPDLGPPNATADLRQASKHHSPA